jgi:chemotaxis protein histidine kinase CheA/ActR/RegA family two-component response regulator
MEHDRILGYFLEEAVEHLNTIEQGLLNLPETVKQPAMIRELFRAAHSIKGSAAMLGLADVQKVGNQFEANFKLLKEQPQIAVDKQLQSLFLESFRFLRAGIEEVRVSKDPYRQDPNTPDPIGDPVFEELKSYLQQLLSTTEPTIAPTINQNPGRDPALEQVFGEYVTRKLAEIISLCSQSDRLETRTQIQQICQKLGNLGENFEFLEWTNLFTACRLATANPANHLPKLGETIETAVKQAQILILADRHQSITITPDLADSIAPQTTADRLVPESIGTWGLDDIASMNLDAGNTTQKLIGKDNHPIILQQHSVPVSSVSSSGGSFNFDDSGLFTDRATFSELAVDSDELELNEFMNMLSDDMPTEGTWMDDDDFFGQELPLRDSPDSMFLTTNIASANLVEDEPKLVSVGYDEETFYSPDFEGVNDGEMPSFLSDTKLAAAQHQPIDLGLDLNAIDRQFQPESGSNLDLNFSAPDFSLDRPMSELFPTVAAPESWPAVADPLLTDLSAVEHQVEPNDFQLDLQSSTIEPEIKPEIELDDSPLPPAASAIENPIDNFDLQLADAIDSLPSTGDGNLSTSDILLFEELARPPLPELPIEAHSQNASDSEGLSDELGNWFDLEIDASEEISGKQDRTDDLQDFDLDMLNSMEAGITASIDDDLAGFDFDAFGADDSSVTDSLINHSVETEVTSSILQRRGYANDNDLAGLDFDGFGADDSIVTDSSIDNPIEAEVTRSIADSLEDFNFDDISDKLAIENSDGADLSDLDFDLFSDNLASTSSDTFGDDAIAELDLNLPDMLALDPAADVDLQADLDLARSNNLESLADLNLGNDFEDLGLDLDIDSPSAEFGDLSELDFDLGDISTDIASHELTDLGDIFGELPESNLAQMDDLDALFSGENIGSGVPGATFDDLDALMMDAAPTAATEPNFDDLDALMSTGSGAAIAAVAAVATVVSPADNNPKPKSTDRKSAKQARTFEQTMRVSVRHLDNLNNLVGELVVNRNTLEQDQNRMRQFIEKLLSEVQKLNDVGKRMQDLYERSLMENSLVASRQQAKANSNSSNNSAIAQAGGEENSNGIEYDPLEMDKFTPIHLLSQKMIELTVRVRESTADIEFVVDGSTEVTRTLRQITGQLQEDLTKSRMIPFAQTADRLQRGVRDNGLKYGKQVELTVEGRDTLIDKVILESLTDPLIHMVNNGIAHGIESIEARQAAGKPADGKIMIRALHQGNQTIISISDDGAGIDTERVKQKALEKGIITPQKAATMSKAEIYDLLFLPSFSTKDQADELAGRGVGMDVVRTSITEIRGTITTESTLGVGTTFTIRLPLALSIAKALIAVNNKCNIAFPMDGIEDTQDVSPEQIQTNADGQQCIFWRDEMMPFKPLSELLEFNRPLPRNNFYTTNEDDSDLVSILILRSDGNLTAVQVDKIIGDQEIAIKPLQGPASKPLGIAGATVMGDGRIIPIADVMELIDLAKGILTRQVSAEWTTQMAASTVQLPESMVLIVDDSITVRELLSLTFKRAGYRVEQARDGQEAWDKLRAGLPCDIVFCDIEMPRMDGLEFLSRVQKDAALSKVPVAMLTSRGSDRHRQIAAQLGASGYFIKPYLEEALLDAAKRMIKGEVLPIVSSTV